jgi:putative methanogenesis marker protein 12
MKVFSHGMSPEKVGLAYGVFRQGSSSFIVCDASSNTVSFAVLRGEIVAAIDAPIFAPGLLQGPLDVQAIRDVDSGKLTANQAFNWGGILSKIGRKGLDQCSPEERHLAMETLAIFAAMEMAALLVLCRDLGHEDPKLFLAGSPAREIEPRVSAHLDRRVVPLERSAAAQGCARIAEDVFAGKENILGIAVDERVRAGKEG